MEFNVCGVHFTCVHGLTDWLVHYLHTCCAGACSLSPDEFAYCAWYIVDRFPMVDSYIIGPLMPVHEMICGSQNEGILFFCSCSEFTVWYTGVTCTLRCCCCRVLLQVVCLELFCGNVVSNRCCSPPSTSAVCGSSCLQYVWHCLEEFTISWLLQGPKTDGTVDLVGPAAIATLQCNDLGLYALTS